MTPKQQIADILAKNPESELPSMRFFLVSDITKLLRLTQEMAEALDECRGAARYGFIELNLHRKTGNWSDRVAVENHLKSAEGKAIDILKKWDWEE